MGRPDTDSDRGLKTRPVHAILATTSACNARCAHCSIAATSGHPGEGELDTETWLGLLEQVAAAGVLFVGLSGGEALLRHDTPDLVRASEQLGMFVSLATNGPLLTGDTVRDLKRAGLHGVLISIDHSDPERHDSIRGVAGLFDAAMAAIATAVDAGLDVVLGFTPMKTNHEALESLIELAAESGCVGVNVSQYMPAGRGTPELDLHPGEWHGLLVRVVGLTELYRSRLRIQYHDPRLALLAPFSDLKPICQAGFSHFYVLPDGNITPCNMMPGHIIGNAITEGLMTVLARFQCHSHLHDRSLLEGACGDCGQQDQCGGCRANALLYTGSIHGFDPKCWIRTGSIRPS